MALLNTWASQQDQATLSPLSRLLNNYIQKGDAPLAYLMRGDAQGLLKDLNTPKPVNTTQDMTDLALNLVGSVKPVGNVTKGLLGSLDDVIKPYKDMGIDISAYVSKNKPELTVSKIVVPKEMRSQGIGTQVMQDITNYADQTGNKVTLTPSTSFGATSVGRLKDFYKNLGFVENKGKLKDFSTRETMYREPKGLLSKTQFEKAQELASKNAETLLGLPKGNTAMDRAKAMGYDVNDILYHGTSSDVSNLIPSKGGEFGPGVYVSQNPNMANYFASRFGGESANIMPLVTNANDVLVTADKNIPRGLGYKGLTNKGYNSVIGIGSTGETQRTILNPENLRSVNAAFDPARANEPDLLAATLAIPVSGLLEQPKDKKKKK